jgi:hypothetical protein
VDASPSQHASKTRGKQRLAMVFTKSSRWETTGPCQEIIGRISGILDKNLTSVKVRLVLADE